MSGFTTTTDETSSCATSETIGRTDRDTPANARQYAFTYFPQGSEVFPFQPEFMSYMIYQYEICPETNRRHIQGYFQCSKPKKASPIIKQFKGIYLRKAFATPSANIAYCSKIDTRDPAHPEVFTYGTPRGAKENVTIDQVADRMRSGESYSELLKDDDIPPIVLMRNRKYILPFEADLHRNVIRDVEVTLITGGSGFGKTHLAWSQAPDPDDVYQPVIQEGQPLWFDNYMGQPILLLNDILPNSIGRTMMLNICDKYPMPIPVKGSRANAKWTKVIITSNADGEDWERQIPELIRRVKNHAHFDEYKKFDIYCGRIIHKFTPTSIIYFS